MTRVLVAAMLFCCSICCESAQVVPPLPPNLPVLDGSLAGPIVSALAPLPHPHKGAFDFRFVNVGQLVDLLYDDAMQVPHVISSDVLNDPRVVSFKYDTTQGDLHEFVKIFLDSLGFAVQSRDGVDFVGRKDAAGSMSDERATFVYRPKYRDAAYLAKLVQPLFSGRMSAVPAASAQTGSMSGSPGPLPAISSSAAGPVSASSASVLNDGAMSRPVGLRSTVATADDLVFFGTAGEIRDLKKVLPEIDTSPGQVQVRGWVYEVSDTDQNNSAFSIAAHLLDGQLGISNGQASSDSTALTFDAHFLNVAISALRADSRFKEVSDPHVRVISGGKVRLNVGSQVPTLGSISYQGTSGTPVQSVEYQAAGVIFDVAPEVLGDAIRVTLDEQISSFVPTTTGVNNSPTKNTREMSTTVSLRDGEVVVLGGLTQDSESVATTHEGWLPRWLDGHSGVKGRTEVLVVLQVQRV